MTDPGKLDDLLNYESPLLNFNIRPPQKTYFGLKRNEWILILILCSVEFLYSLVLLSHGAFFPQEAIAKGVSPSVYGFVFGAYEVVMVVMSIVWGNFINKMGPRKTYMVGVFICGSSTFLFGFLQFINSTNIFTALAFGLRIYQGIGDSAYICASFTIITMQFPDSIGTKFATLQSVFGFGFIIGPQIVANIYMSGGFKAPYILVGSLLLFVLILFTFASKFLTLKEENDDELSTKSGLLSLIKIPSVMLDAFSIIPASISIGFIEATLQPHLAMVFFTHYLQYNLKPLYGTMIYSLFGVFYSISAPVFGKIAGNTSEKKYLTLLGSLLICLGFSLLGPLPFLPIQSYLWISCIGLVIHGIGLGSTCVSAFLLGLEDSMENGFPDNIMTYGLVSGLWKATFSLGNAIGPSLGGILYDSVGFRNETFFVVVIEILFAIFLVFYIINKKVRRRREDSLLNSINIPTSTDTIPKLFFSDYGTISD